MLNSKRHLEDLELFEELDDRLSEKISGGVQVLAIQVSGFDDISGQIKLNLSNELGIKLEELVPDISDKDSLSLVCVDNKCQGLLDNVKLDFTIEQ